MTSNVLSLQPKAKRKEIDSHYENVFAKRTSHDEKNERFTLRTFELYLNIRNITMAAVHPIKDKDPPIYDNTERAALCCGDRSS